MSRPKVLLTDHPWPDADIERTILGAAGLELVEPSTPGDSAELLERSQAVSAILTCWAPVPEAMIRANPELRLVARIGVGLDNIDVGVALSQGVVVTNVPDYCIEEVSDHVLAMVHAWARGIVPYNHDVHNGDWSPTKYPLRRVADLKIAIFGLGRIGSRVAEKFGALGATVYGVDPGRDVPAHLDPHLAKDELLRIADVVTIHVPLNTETAHMVDATFLSAMKPGALLVNASRGGLVDTQALVAGLNAGRPAAAALDVIETEPTVPRELLELPNVLMTPHVAFFSDHSILELRRRACEEVVRVLKGAQPLHPVQ